MVRDQYSSTFNFGFPKISYLFWGDIRLSLVFRMLLGETVFEIFLTMNVYGLNYPVVHSIHIY